MANRNRTRRQRQVAKLRYQLQDPKFRDSWVAAVWTELGIDYRTSSQISKVWERNHEFKQLIRDVGAADWVEFRDLRDVDYEASTAVQIAIRPVRRRSDLGL